jgi:hypothetical protein
MAHRLGRQVHPSARPDATSDLHTPKIIIIIHTALFIFHIA